MRPGTSEVGLLPCDPTRAESLLGWRPEVGLDEGLAPDRRRYLERRDDNLHADEYVV